MIDREKRQSLQRLIRRLLLDRLPVGELDDAFFFRYSATHDEAVREVATLCHAFYPEARQNHETHYRIADPGMRGTLARAFLFLRSDLEYEWQQGMEFSDRWGKLGLVLLMFVPVVMGFLYFALPVSVATSAPVILAFAAVGSAGMFFSLMLLCRDTANRPVGLSRPTGDGQVWPFFRAVDLERIPQGL